MWSFDQIIEWFLGKAAERRKHTLAGFLEPCRFQDLRSEMQAPSYVNEHLPIPRRTDINTIVLHCTADDDKPDVDVFKLARYDVSPSCHINPGVGCPTITYHYYIEFVGGDCMIYRCLDHGVKAWHVGAYWNATCLGVALDYDGASELPKMKWDAAAKMIAWLCRELEIEPAHVMFHRELEHTGWVRGAHGERILRKTCPGHRLDPAKFREDVASHLAFLTG